MRKWIILLAGILQSLLIFSTGCSTTSRSVGLGAGSGAVIGSGIGALADPGPNGKNRIRNALIGTAVGGAVGAGTGFIADRVVNDAREESYKKGKRDSEKETFDREATESRNRPTLVPAKTEARWVPDQIRGSTFVPGHFEYQIIEGARWQTNR